VGLWFVSRYAIRYYIPGSSVQIGLTYARRIALLAHISGGIVALIVGPWQFFTLLRNTHPRVHRIAGYTYLSAVAVAAPAALLLAATTSNGWAWGFGVGMLGCFWVISTAIAFYAITKRTVSAHREWMQRSYIATFAFASFRLLVDYPPMSHLAPAHDLYVSAIWASWVLPMLAREVLIQMRDLRRIRTYRA